MEMIIHRIEQLTDEEVLNAIDGVIQSLKHDSMMLFKWFPGNQI